MRGERSPQRFLSADGARSRALLTRDDTAAYLAVSKRTLDRLIQAGEIPAYRIGGHRRFRIEDIDSFIMRRKE
jgi:excisionase family DNA binding protein